MNGMQRWFTTGIAFAVAGTLAAAPAPGQAASPQVVILPPAPRVGLSPAYFRPSVPVADRVLALYPDLSVAIDPVASFGSNVTFTVTLSPGSYPLAFSEDPMIPVLVKDSAFGAERVLAIMQLRVPRGGGSATASLQIPAVKPPSSDPGGYEPIYFPGRPPLGEAATHQPAPPKSSRGPAVQALGSRWYWAATDEVTVIVDPLGQLPERDEANNAAATQVALWIEAIATPAPPAIEMVP
jgi:hypothetical protein